MDGTANPWYPRKPAFRFDLYKFMIDDTASDSEQKKQLRQLLESHKLRPTSAGAYVFSADKCELGEHAAGFIYPFGRSRVYYIGKTDKPMERFRYHSAHADWAAQDLACHDEQAFSDPVETRHYPLYAYASKFGAWIKWWNTRGQETAKSLERTLQIAFYRRFGSIPVANLRFEELGPEID